MAEVNPPDSVSAKMDSFFCDEVKRLSNGTVEIDLNTSAVLGDESEVLAEMISSKKIDLARISLMELTKYGAKKSTILTLPYIFNDRKHFWKFAKSDLADEVLYEPSNTNGGVTGIFLAEEGFRHFFSTKELKSIEDLDGQRIRTSDDPVFQNVIKDLGAIPFTVQFSEIIKEMILGNIDAADQPIVNYQANFFHTVAPNMILDGHRIGATEVIMTNSAWDSLTPELKKIFKKAGSNAADYCRSICEESERKAMEALEKEGVVFTEITDKSSWQEACKLTIKKQTSSNMDFYERIVEMGKSE
ncbi:MAG: TRAP transporter substrate-binding protein [Treponema sp.]|nr:TRAP transporter substrate-binding protein [Candidatus Treponema equi]